MSTPSIPSQDVVRAQRFELVDHTGRVLAALGINDRANPTLSFYDARGVPRALIGVWGETGEPVLQMVDSASRLRINLSQRDTGRAYLSFLDEDDRRADFGTRPDGRGALTFWDRQGNPVDHWCPEPAPPARPSIEQLLNAEPTVTPEDTLRAAGVSSARQARYQRRMSTLLAGRHAAPAAERAR